MAISLYSASVPVFVRYLAQLEGSLKEAAAQATRDGIAEASLLDATLTDGMFPLAQQVTTACGFTLRACCPLLGIEVPPMDGNAESLAGLQARVDATVRWLGTLDEAAMAAAEEVPVIAQAGFATRHFSGREYVLNYALPNFFFHLCMAHAILRAQGIAIGKQDFDGYHQYPRGFSFTTATAS